MTFSRSLLAAAGLGLALTPILAEASTRTMSNLKPSTPVSTPSNVQVPDRHEAPGGRHSPIPPRHGGEGSNGAGGVTPTPAPRHALKRPSSPSPSPTPTFTPTSTSSPT